MKKLTKGTVTLRRFFPDLSEKEMAFLQEGASLLKFKKGQNLFLSGDTPRSLYAIANGCLKIVRENQDGDSLISRIVVPGNLIGIRELFGELKYNRAAIALKDSEVFSIDKNTLMHLQKTNNSLSYQLLKALSFELENLEQRLEQNLFRSAKARVAYSICELFHFFSFENKQFFILPVSKRDLAELSDVTPETVSRCLAEFKQAGILETQGSKMKVLDLISLQNEAE
jgi:CRP-like cAMP-binding protein